MVKSQAKTCNFSSERNCINRSLYNNFTFCWSINALKGGSFSWFALAHSFCCSIVFYFWWHFIQVKSLILFLLNPDHYFKVFNSEWMSKLKIKVSYLQKWWKSINGVQLRTVAYSCVLIRVQLRTVAYLLARFCGFRSITSKKLNRFNFLCTLSRTVWKKSAYTWVQLCTHPQLYATLVEKPQYIATPPALLSLVTWINSYPGTDRLITRSGLSQVSDRQVTSKGHGSE